MRGWSAGCQVLAGKRDRRVLPSPDVRRPPDCPRVALFRATPSSLALNHLRSSRYPGGGLFSSSKFTERTYGEAMVGLSSATRTRSSPGVQSKYLQSASMASVLVL